MTNEIKLAAALLACLSSDKQYPKNLGDANVVDGLFEIASALKRVAKAVEDLGTGNAATDGMGAVELHAKQMRETGEQLVSALLALSGH